MTAVDRHVRFHPEVPLLALRRLMHLGVPLTLLVLRRMRIPTDRDRRFRGIVTVDSELA
jgi:hypothetical protein